jgi:hypothetical protein
LEGARSIGMALDMREPGMTLLVHGPTLVTADATVNIVGIYASDVDTVSVWGADFGWPDIHLTDVEPAVYAPVEEGTWGQIKTYLLNSGR